MLDKITLDDIQPSSRRYPFVGFTPERKSAMTYYKLKMFCND